MDTDHLSEPLLQPEPQLRRRGTTFVDAVTDSEVDAREIDADHVEDFSYLDSEIISDKKEVYSWWLYDWSNSGYQGNIANAFGGPALTALAVYAAAQSPDGKLYLFGGGTGPSVAPTSYFQLLVIVSVVCQIVGYLMLGPIADFGNLKKIGLVITTTVSSFFTVGFIICSPEWLGTQNAFKVAAAFYIVGSLLFGVSVIYYYAYLPLLVANHWEMKELHDTGGSMLQLKVLKANLAKKLSSWGVFWGFIAQVAILVVSVGFLFAIPKALPAFNTFFYNGTLVNATACNATSKMLDIVTPLALAGPQLCSATNTPPSLGELLQYRVVLALAGVWFFAFSIPAFCWLKSRPGQPLPQGAAVLCMGFKSIGHTAKKIKKLPHTLLFLISYFIFSDGLSTVGNVAPILFAVEVGMDATLIAGAVAVSFIMGAVSTLLWLWISKCVPWMSAKPILIINILGLGLVPLWGFVGLTTTWEAFCAAAAYGAFFGPVASFARSAFSRMTPKGLEAEFFSFYEISDKGSSWLGPLVVTVVNEATGNFRAAVFAVVGFFLLGAVLLLPVNFARANKDALDFWSKHSDEFDEDERAAGGVPRMRVGTMNGMELPDSLPRYSVGGTAHRYPVDSEEIQL